MLLTKMPYLCWHETFKRLIFVNEILKENEAGVSRFQYIMGIQLGIFPFVRPYESVFRNKFHTESDDTLNSKILMPGNYNYIVNLFCNFFIIVLVVKLIRMQCHSK